METFISRLGVISTLLIILWIIGTNIIRLVIWIKCFKIKNCNDRKCPIRDICCKYVDEITSEERQRLLRKISEELEEQTLE